MDHHKETPEQKRERIRQEELERNPAGSIHGGGLPDIIGGLSWKGTGILIVVIIMGLFGVLTYESKFFYPALPIDSVSKKEVLDKIEGSPHDVVKIAEHGNDEWYITRMEQGEAYENIKRMMSENGWQFKTQEGSGFFFEKDERTLIVGTQMWTGKYVLINVSKDWKH